MKHSSSPDSGARQRLEQLRQKAEMRRSLVSTSTENLTPDEIRRLVQELQVHQIELEMQYEELQVAQAEREALHERYVDLYEFAPVGYCTLDAHGAVLQMNLRASQLLGSPRQAVLGRQLAQYVYGDEERDELHRFLHALLASEARQTSELELQRPDGSTFFALLEGVRLPDESGAARLRVALTDDTARRRTATALAASEQKFRAIFDESADATLLVQDMRYIDCNQAAMDLLGATRREQIVGQPVTLLAPEQQADGVSSLQHVLRNLEQTRQRGSYRFEWQRRTFQGREIWLEIVLTHIQVPGEQLLHCVWRDITEQKRRDQQLRESEIRFRTIFEQSADAMLLLRDGVFADCNPAALTLIGAARREQLVGMPAWARTPEVQPNGRNTQEWFRENIEKARLQGSFRCEALMQRFTGDDIWVEAVLTPIVIPDQPLLMHVAWRDVTEHNRLMTRLQESEKQFVSAISAARMGLAVWDFAAWKVRFDARAAEIYGYPPEPTEADIDEAIARTHPDDYPRISALLQQTGETNEPYGADCRLQWPDGTVRYVKTSGQMITDEQGRLTRAAGVVRDVTERRLASQRLRQSEARLREEEERLRLALRASQSGVWEWTPATDELYWDERAQQIFGREFNAQPVPFGTMAAAVHPDELPAVQAALQATLTADAPFQLEHRIVWPDGTIRHVAALARLTPAEDGEERRLIGLVRDVSSEYEAQEELQYQNRLLHNILENMPVVLARVAPDGTILEATGAGLRRIGVTGSELNGTSLYEGFPRISAAVQQLMIDQQPASFLDQTEYRGSPRAYYQIFGFYEPQRQVAVLFSLDVTDTERVRQRLQAERDFTQSLLETSTDGIVAVDAERRITVWNQALEQFSGTPRAAVLGHDARQVVPHSDQQLFQSVEARLRAGEEIRYYNLPMRQREGKFDVHFAPLLDARGAFVGALGIVRDVTERSRLEEEATQLRLNQQKEVLSAILNTQEDERQRIAEALHNGVGQLLYASKLHLEPQPVDDAHRASALNLLNEAIKATRTISFELTPNVLLDFGLKSALEELTKRIPNRNLMVHLHADALDEPLPRLLEIALYRIVQELLNNVIKHAQAREVFIYVERDGVLQLSVEDDGVGFEPEAALNLHKGIGLAGIRNRVELLAGTLTIRSAPGRGTTVRIELPTGTDTGLDASERLKKAP